MKTTSQRGKKKDWVSQEKERGAQISKDRQTEGHIKRNVELRVESREVAVGVVGAVGAVALEMEFLPSH